MSEQTRAIYTRSVDLSNHQLDVAVREEGTSIRLRVEAQINEIGVLFRLCAALFRHGLNISKATIKSEASGRIMDEFFIEPIGTGPLEEPVVRSLIDDLQELMFGGLSVLEYLTRNDAHVPHLQPSASEVVLKQTPAGPRIEIHGADRAGLLLVLSQAFFLMDINIIEADIETDVNQVVRNRFVVDPADARFDSKEFQRRLVEDLKLLF